MRWVFGILTKMENNKIEINLRRNILFFANRRNRKCGLKRD